MPIADLCLLDCAALSTRLHQLSGEERNPTPCAPRASPVDLGTSADSSAIAIPSDSAPVLQPYVRRPEVRAVTADLWSLRVTLDAEAKRDLETLTMLLGHKVPNGDLAGVLKEALRCAIDRHGKRKGAVKPSRPRSPSTTRSPAPDTRPVALSTSIPAEVRRLVWERDGGCCTWTAPDGTRCGSRWKLEFDHIQPKALGGPSTVGNIRIRCRSPEVSPVSSNESTVRSIR
jgi:hypothetical protein